MEWKEVVLIIYKDPLVQGIFSGIFGGLTRTIVDWKGKLKLKTIIQGFVAASFVGAITVQVVDYVNANKKIGIIISLAGGLAHIEMIGIIKNKLLNKINKSLKNHSDEDDKY